MIDGGAPLLSRGGGVWTPASDARGFKEALAAAKLDNITLHELRHSYASMMVKPGVCKGLRGTRGRF